MENIDVIFYINLESRVDRKEHFLNEISKLCRDVSKIVRIEAVKNNNGALGCAMSHCKALEMFIENQHWDTCIIFEDDFTFYKSEIDYNNNKMMTLFNKFPNWDCCLLAAGVTGLKLKDTSCDAIKKVISAQTTSGYCVTRQFAPTLLKNFCEAKDDMTKNGKRHTNHIDQHWKLLQPFSNWYAIDPLLGHQYENYSDIEKKTIKYGC